MRKPALMTNERLSRFTVSLLLCLGILLPLLMTFGLGATVLLAALSSAALIAVLTALCSSKKGRLGLAVGAAALSVLQLFLPNAGLFGGGYEALKALTLYFNGITPVARIFSNQIAMLLAVILALVSYAFSARGAGYLPAAILTVIMLFCVWSLNKAVYLWYALPALIALLLLIAQSSHEKINLFEVLPMAALVVLLSMLLLPAGKVAIPPLNKAAMELRQTIFDYLYFNDPRNLFTLGNYGYYPMGSGKLGGKAEPNEYPVMTVKTERRTLMRGVVKDEYTGRNWRDTSSAKRYLYISPRWAGARERVFLEKMPPEPVRAASTLLDERAVSVQVQNTVASTVFTPLFLRGFTAQNDMVGYFNDASELFITRDLQRDDRYTVFAPVFEGGDNGLGPLIIAAPKGNDPYYQDALGKYTALPGHLEQKVYDDLKNIIAASSEPYEQACAIMRHLQRYYRYTLSPQEPPENMDFVTYFLYVGKEGYCTYFASAMTVLCRMAGLPARYVEGFSAKPSGDGLAYVTGLDAHAWTEVYFEGFGWVPFDATPAQQSLDNPPPQNEQEPEPTPSPSPSPSPEPEEEPSPEPEDNPNPSQEPDMEESEPPETPPEEPPYQWWWWLLAVAAMAALCARIWQRMPDQVAKKREGELDKLFVYGNAAFMVAKLLKRTPRSGETPLFFARRMDKQRAFPTPILPLWRMLALSNYSRMETGAEQTAKARETFHQLYQPQKPLLKLRFMLSAAFGNKCYTCLETHVTHVDPVKLYTYQPKAAQGKHGNFQRLPEKPEKASKEKRAKPKGKKAKAPSRGGRQGNKRARR